MGNTSYFELKTITDSVYEGIKVKWAKDVIGILQKHDIKLRQKNGKLYSVNISIPKTKSNCILVGLRYIKRDETYTEDHFLFEQNKPIIVFYKGKLQKIFTEYEGTHKQQLV